MLRPISALYRMVVDHRTASGWRIPALDGLRGIAALLVLVAHVRHATAETSPLYWAPIERGGLGGVILFFALSGFLLYLPWLRAELEGRPPPRFRTYAIRRCLRIMPAYYASVIALAVLRVVIGDRDPISAQALGLHFVFLPTLGSPLQTVYWTLQVEEFFYWLLPALHALAARTGASAVLSLSFVVCGLWFTVGTSWLPPARWAYWFEQTPFFLPVFVLGIMAARQWKGHARLGGRTLVVLGTAGYLGLSVVALAITGQDETWVPVSGLMIAPAACAVVLGVARGGAPLLEHPVLRFVGGISFSLYLWHLVVIKVVPCPAAIADSFGLRLAFTLAIAVPVALASTLLVERPFLKLRPNDAPPGGDVRA